MAQGRYETVFLMEQSRHPDDGIFQGGDLYVTAALLTGRYTLTEKLLVPHVRQYGATHGDYYLELSIAAAARGRVYPGQGAYVADALRQSLTPDWGDMTPLMTKAILAPATPKDTLLASLLALGVRSPSPYSSGYLEWAMRLDQTSGIAARRLFDDYSATHQYAEATRIARGMIAHLPKGNLRDHYVEMLKYVEGKKNEPLPVRRSNTQSDQP